MSGSIRSSVLVSHGHRTDPESEDYQTERFNPFDPFKFTVRVLLRLNTLLVTQACYFPVLCGVISQLRVHGCLLIGKGAVTTCKARIIPPQHCLPVPNSLPNSSHPSERLICPAKLFVEYLNFFSVAITSGSRTKPTNSFHLLEVSY